MDFAGLLGKFAGLPGAIGQGLLGIQNPSPALGLDANSVQQARQQALTDLAMGMMAGRGPQGMFAATNNARQGYQSRVFDMLKEQEMARMMQSRAERDKQLAAVRQQYPQWASLPDEQLLALVKDQESPTLKQDQAQFDAQQATHGSDAALAQARFEQQMALERAQLGQQQANSDRLYNLELAKIAAAGGKTDEVELRKRRESALSSSNMLSLLGQLKEDIAQNGTETFGSGAGRQGALYGQILSEFKQAKQMGTLDKGLLELFDKMLADPTKLMNSMSASGFSGKIPAQLDALISQTQDQYQKDYDFLKSNKADLSGLPDIAANNSDAAAKGAVEGYFGMPGSSSRVRILTNGSVQVWR